MTQDLRLRAGTVVRLEPGPLLTAGVARGPGIVAHRVRWGSWPRPGLPALIELARGVDLRGRGGAGFPFADKLAAFTEGHRAEVVVNFAEGEPTSAKDGALAIALPHLVLDGAATCAHAVGARTVHLVLPSERPAVGAALRRAVDERRSSGGEPRWRMHRAAPRFVGGQAQAVLELLAGRENLPVTTWQPAAVRGHRRRPTLLSNAETFAHVAAIARLGARGYCMHGTPGEPGTTLLTLRGDGPAPLVREVPYGTPWRDVLSDDELARPVLLGGYHGTWAAPGELATRSVARTELAAAGLALGAGVVLPLDEQTCPLRRTAEVVGYLAAESAGRCGPCTRGLPALAAEVAALAAGGGDPLPIRHLAARVTGRGACAHPDGTARLVTSLLSRFPAEVEAHLRGGCTTEAVGPPGVGPHQEALR